MESLRNIPGHWELKTLGEIGAVVNGLTYSPNDVSEEGLLVLRSSNIQDGVLAFEDNVFVDSGAVKYNPIKTNDILICVRNGSRRLIGKNTMIPSEHEGVAFGAFMTVYRSDYNQFLQHVFSTDIFYWEVHRNLGATINSINGSDLKKFKVPFPPLSEQKKIAEILSKWDELIETQTQLIAAKEQQKKGLMQKLLTGELRFPGFEGEWEVVKLKELISKFIVPMRDKPKSLTGPIPWCRIEDFEGKFLKASKSNQGVTEDTVNQMNLKVYPVGTVLVSCSANLGKCAIVDTPLVTNQTFIGLTPKVGVNNEFIYYLMGFSEQRLNRLSSGTTISYLSRVEFENFKLKIPMDENEQIRISSTLNSIDDELIILNRKLDEFKTQKKGLMQQLLTGKIRVKV